MKQLLTVGTLQLSDESFGLRIVLDKFVNLKGPVESVSVILLDWPP